MSRSRFIIATLVAPVAALVGPTLLAIAVAMLQRHAEAAPGPDGAFDDGPVRAVGVFLVVGLPVLYLLAAVFYAVVGAVLAREGRLTLWVNTGLAAAAGPLVPVVIFWLLSGNAGDLLSPLALGLTGLTMSFFAALGAATWWFVAAGGERRGGSMRRPPTQKTR